MFLRKIVWFLSVVLCFGLINVSAQAQTPKPKMISAGVINAKATSLPKPEYPAAARAVGASGTVEVLIIYDEQGNVESAEAFSGHPLLRAAAVEAARQAKFAPTLLSGNPVKVSGRVIYNFTLPERDSTGSSPSGDKNQDRAFIVGDSATTTSKDKTFDTERSINGGVVNGKAINLPVPVYPAAALAVKAGGAVNVRVKIDTQGNIVQAEAVSGHPLLQAAAVEAARQAKFKPTLLEGNPVIVTGIIIYNFNLTPPPQDSGELNEKNKNWGVGFILSVFREADSSLVAETDFGEDFGDDLPEMMEDFPEEFIAEKESFEKLATSKGVERQRIAAVLSNSFKKFYSGSDSVEYEIGQTTGVIFVQLVKKGLSLNGKNVQTNDAILKENLLKLSNLLNSDSLKMSSGLLEKLREISSFANVPDFNSSETVLKLLALVEPLLNAAESEK